jgi:hypothetical protein
MPTTTEKTKGTEYVVLQVVVDEDDNATYVPVGDALGATITANNDRLAIRAAVGELPTPGNYVAIPVRSFKVRPVGVQTEPKITVG